MSADCDGEGRFIARCEAFQVSPPDAEPALQALEDWFAGFGMALQGSRIEAAGFNAHRGLAVQVDAINRALDRNMQAWPHLWARLQDALALGDVFGDSVVLLVFGKFNAGKSSFCNFIASRYLAHGKQVEFFRLDAGRILEAAQAFEVGETETTTGLQGVRLGKNLVLVDTPGFHSANLANAELSRRYTESADALLWLTSSASPGQVQELEELGRELHRNKVLLPVVTRSDVIEEDEVDGELRRSLRNKTRENRALQEADVRARAVDKLVSMHAEPTLVSEAVSVSVLAAHAQGLTPTALAEAGFDRLYAALLGLVEPALAYKRRKRAEVFLHHLEERVLGMLQSDVMPLLSALNASLRTALDTIELQQERIVEAAWRQVMPALPAELEKHAASTDTSAACDGVSRWVRMAFVGAVSEHWREYDLAPEVADARIELDGAAGYERVVVDEDGVSGEGPEAWVSYERLHALLEKAMRKRLRRMAEDMSGQVRATIQGVMHDVARLEKLLDLHGRALSRLKRELRSD